jgi:release factor glutamine methyltransferase
VTIRDGLIRGARRLEASRVPNPRMTAERLLAWRLAVDRAYLYAHGERVLAPEEARAFLEAVGARAEGVPTQYIVGTQEFFGRSFAVGPAVLIPRPETELLVECALARILPATAPRIADVGTGSGAIAVTVALERPSAHVVASDVSAEALGVASRNAEILGASVSFLRMDMLEALAGGFDFILSNPPYVDPADAPTLEREVRDHEPGLALFASDAGLGTIRRLIPEAARVLKPGGWLIFEMGMDMKDRILPLFDSGWERPAIEPDLRGIARTVIARRVG